MGVSMAIDGDTIYAVGTGGHIVKQKLSTMSPSSPWSGVTSWFSPVALLIQKSTLPHTVSLSVDKLDTVHDHEHIDVDDVNSTLVAWATKYSFPAEVLSSLSALAAVESVDFKDLHEVFQGHEGEIFEIAASGRNYNGAVSLAFAYGRATGTVTKYPSASRDLKP